MHDMSRLERITIPNKIIVLVNKKESPARRRDSATSPPPRQRKPANGLALARASYDLKRSPHTLLLTGLGVERTSSEGNPLSSVEVAGASPKCLAAASLRLSRARAPNVATWRNVGQGM